MRSTAFSTTARVIFAFLVCIMSMMLPVLAVASSLLPYYVSVIPPSIGFTGPPYAQYYDPLPAGFAITLRSLDGSAPRQFVVPTTVSVDNVTFGERPYALRRLQLGGNVGVACVLWSELRLPVPTVGSSFSKGPASGCFATGLLPSNVMNLFNPFDRPVTETFTFEAPTRRTALDGSEYEASAMVLRRNNVPWVTYHFAYRLGLVAGESNWSESGRSVLPTGWPVDGVPKSMDDFELAKLPPPFVDGEVVEYVNSKVAPESPGGHYFYAASVVDRDILDTQPDWLRTGRSFKSGGYLPVCRFLYSPPGGGAATHFFTARADECAALKVQSGFTYEGTPFRTSLPKPAIAGQQSTDPARCPEKTVALYRAFNNPMASGNKFAPNHRYVRNMNAMATFLAQAGWVTDDISLCVPE